MANATHGLWLACTLGAVSAPRPAFADGATCGPVAELTGDSTVVAQVAPLLVARGITVKTSAGCPSVVVVLDRHDDLIVADIRDANGRTTRRTVTQASEAASVIESWVRPLDADLLAGFAVEAQPAATLTSSPAGVQVSVVSPGEPPSDAAVRSAVNADARPRDPFSIALTGDAALSASRSPMFGPSATMCVRLSRWCLGATGHLWRTADGSSSESEILAAVDLPFAIGRVAVIPGLAVGAGNVVAANMTDGQNQNQDQPPDGWGFRAEGRVHATYPLSRRVLVDAVVGVVAAPYSSAQSQNGVASSVVDVGVQLGAGVRVGAW